MVTSSDRIKEVTVVAPINIALIKYWGKRDEVLMLPYNDSISISINDICAKTRLRIGPSVTEDSVFVNGVKMDLDKEKGFLRLFSEVRRLTRKRKVKDSVCNDEDASNSDKFSKFEVMSETNFPVGAGLASSAAGYAAIAFALGKLYNFDESDIVRIARQGSGSACRSIMSGFVHWKAGIRQDGTDCICETVASPDHWKSLRAIVLVTLHEKKSIGSTSGMRQTAKTSELFRHRVDKVIPEHVKKLRKAIYDKDFATFAAITMSESNQLHALCMDTNPPLKYLSEDSWHLIRIVHAVNDAVKSTKLAYTFDAGPNCTLFLEEDFVPTALAAVKKYCLLTDDLFGMALNV
uniref:Diphosphomevalonate decarboxylase n=1 Tax=Syphacia muris TaxID=451379 RepID=A0A0N5AW35_9BILA